MRLIAVSAIVLSLSTTALPDIGQAATAARPAPTAAERPSVAAALRPRTLTPSFIIAPAPRRPMPETT